MEIIELEDEIKEIKKVKEHYKPGSIEWNNIDAIITDKKRILSRLKRQEESEDEDIPGSCGGDCGSCGGVR